MAFGLFWTRSLVTIWWLAAHAHLSPSRKAARVMSHALETWSNSTNYLLQVLWIEGELHFNGRVYHLPEGSCLIIHPNCARTDVSDGNFLKTAGYARQAPPPALTALTMGVDGGTPPINWRDIN